MTRSAPRPTSRGKQTAPAKAGSRGKAAPAKASTKAAPAAAKSQAAKVVRRLKADYPDVECALVHKSAFQLLISTILSAQCTDARVNMVTPELFRRWPTAAHMAKAPIAQLEKTIRSTGFFRNKAKNIQACSRELVDQYDGDVPREIEQLVALPGIGRKTANVVLGTAYGIATGVVVDTHVGRLSRRLGLTKHADAVKVERDLVALLAKREWIEFSHRMIHHGRAICSARKPLCGDCSMQKFCPQISVK